MKASQSKLICRIGDADVSVAVLNARTELAGGRPGSVTLLLNVHHAVVGDVDYAGTVTVAVRPHGTEEPIFIGSVMRAGRQGDILRIECANGVGLTDRVVGNLQIVNCGMDTIYSLARAAGFPAKDIKVEGFSAAPLEVFEIATAVTGLALNQIERFKGVSFVPPLAGQPLPMANLFDVSESTLEFRTAEAYAVTYVTGRHMYDVQDEALARIDEALAWLTVRARYSSSVTPAGENTPWSRDQMLAHPKRGELVGVRGLLTGRAWMRTAVDSLRLPALPIGTLCTEQPATPERSMRYAFLSCSRAATAVDPVERVTALWDAIEYYVGPHRAPHLFTDEELGVVKAFIPKDAQEHFNQMQLARINEAFGFLNNAPLMVRFTDRLSAEKIPHTQADIKLLGRLRGVRNKASHGKLPEIPDSATIDQGVAIVARILVHHTATVHQ